ncbi:hypothetical protein CHF27_010265 [Romboutsia maritimum]|uniref:Bypass of forespore C C-terminal domain-containing protein n=1 Tax=Romboutsia maritimum TaxID=2020948 RepID=A0A371IRE5_9FIRM|nr:hypothetical protein [Romboutsia maritimum]RDY23056.1 hypothetical protein CHF27_010265 [Romboutsia maritimum]
MFEKKDSFPWKIPVLILTGLLVLSSGIYIGVKTRGNNQVKARTNIAQTNEKTKEALGLNKNCEIWLHQKSEDGSDLATGPSMIGVVPESLLTKTEGEIVKYFKEKYPKRTVESINKYQIILSEKVSLNDPSKANKYSIESNEGIIGLYKYNNKGDRELVEQTQTKLESLPKTVQDEIKKGVLIETEDEAYSRLEDFGS